MRLTLLLTFALTACAPAAATPSPSPLDPRPGERQKLVVERLRSGPQAPELTDSARIVVRDGRTWNRYRDAVIRRGESGYEIDFESRMAVIVALGRQPNTCCTVRVDSAVATAAEVAVFVTRSRLGAGCVVAEVITYPFAAVRLPLRSLAVRFVEQEVVTNCRR